MHNVNQIWFSGTWQLNRVDAIDHRLTPCHHMTEHQNCVEKMWVTTLKQCKVHDVLTVRNSMTRPCNLKTYIIILSKTSCSLHVYKVSKFHSDKIQWIVKNLATGWNSASVYNLCIVIVTADIRYTRVKAFITKDIPKLAFLSPASNL